MARGGTSFSELKNRKVEPTTEQGQGFWRKEPDWHQPLFAELPFHPYKSGETPEQLHR